VRDILQLVDEPPEELVALVVDHADGNPFYIEELVKTLIDDGVVSTADDAVWKVDGDRLRGLSVPPTLAGVLQARLDSLSVEERNAVQHGSVIGRTFWDEAVATLLSDGRDAAITVDGLVATLDRVLDREIVRRAEPSGFAGCREFKFKHALLRDAAYETVLLRHRQRLHRLAAAWMERRAGDRVDEHVARIAEHLVRAETTRPRRRCSPGPPTTRTRAARPRRPRCCMNGPSRAGRPAAGQAASRRRAPALSSATCT
jgi:predicted ATPase